MVNDSKTLGVCQRTVYFMILLKALRYCFIAIRNSKEPC